MQPWQSFIVYAYFAVLAVLSVYGLHRYLLLFLYHRHYKWKQRPAAPARPGAEWPSVTVQIPLYNEMYVARRAIEAAAVMRYPRGKLRVQVLDDSTDATAELVQQTAVSLRARGAVVDVLHRHDRRGFK
ncbi:MAG TPA: glycosyl transferase family 2, partial [Candidatus Krumholzibacteria bacterium]|nr:glycosyl transferase family 2 [Candidatus Krumholzibacteria bacterium]